MDQIKFQKSVIKEEITEQEIQKRADEILREMTGRKFRR